MTPRTRPSWLRIRAVNGQIVILVAALVVVLVGMVGLAVDLGYAFSQKRATQNAADAAALAGARAVTQWSTTNTTVTAMPDASSVAQSNKFGNATLQISCYYVDDNDVKLDKCDQPVPATATGVTVEVAETHPTFFMQVIPGGPKHASTVADASAHAQKVSITMGDAPFIMCGSSAKLLDGSGSIAIMTKVGNSYVINNDAYGRTFEVHGPQIDDCGLGSDSYKGLADETYNEGKSVGDWYNGDTGVHAGPAREEVKGANGCQPTTVEPYNCVMFVPLATNDPPPIKQGNLRLYQVVGYAAFEVSSCGKNCHQATLVQKYIVDTPDGLPSWTPNTWKRGDDGIIAIRLTR